MITKIVQTTTIILTSMSIATSVLAEQTTKILMLAGKDSHGFGAHEFKAGSHLLADALNESNLNIEAKVHYGGFPKDDSIFDGVSACIVYADAGGKFAPDQCDALDEKIKAGMGIMFMHYGVHPTKEIGQKYYSPWIGGFFETGWSVNPHWVADLTPNKNHAVRNGVPESFKINDEWYYNMRFPAKGDGPDQCNCCDSLATAIPTKENMSNKGGLWNEYGEAGLGKPQTLMWCKNPKGKTGRGVGFTGGHFHANWANDHFRKLVLNAIVWTARIEIPKDGVDSQTITKEILNKYLDPKKGILELPKDE